MNGPQRTACLAKGYTDNSYAIFKMNRLYIPTAGLRVHSLYQIVEAFTSRETAVQISWDHVAAEDGSEQHAPPIAKCWILGRPPPNLRGRPKCK